jgi:hypothetical protein
MRKYVKIGKKIIRVDDEPKDEAEKTVPHPVPKAKKKEGTEKSLNQSPE